MQDSLSYLLHQYPLSVEVKRQCDLMGAWSLLHPSHPSTEVCWHWVTQGEVCVKTPMQTQRVFPANSIIFAPAHTHHQLHYVSTQSENRVVCGRVLLPAQAQVFFGSLPEYFYLSPESSPEVGVYCQFLKSTTAVICQERIQQRLGEDGVIEQLIKTLFTLALRAWLEHSTEQKSILLGLLSPRLAPAIHAMFEQPEQKFTVEQLADIVCMSRATFARHFKQATGLTPLKMLETIRMSIAASLLNQPDSRVSQLCYGLGYASESAFYKAFVRYFGITPRQYQINVQATQKVKIAE